MSLFPKDVAFDFVDKFLDDDDHQLLAAKVLELVVSIENQLIKNKYVKDIYSITSIASNLRIKIDRLFVRQILFYNTSWNQVIWCERAKISKITQIFDKDRQLILDFGNQKFYDFYFFEDINYDNLHTIGHLLNLAIILLGNDFCNLKDTLCEHSDFWVNLFLKNSKDVITSNLLLPSGVNDDVRSAVFYSQLPAYDQIVKEYDKNNNL